MIFLEWWNPFTWGDSILDAIVGGVQSALNVLLYFLSTLVHKGIIEMYNIFNILCSTRLLKVSVIQDLSKRIGLILGMVMIFVVAFSCIKMLLDPDGSSKNGGFTDIVKKVLVVIVGLGISTTAFNILYGIQYTIIDSDIVAKLLLPNKINTDEYNFGNVLSANLFLAFYRMNDEEIDMEDNPPGEALDCKESINKLKKDIIMYADYSLGMNCLNERLEYKVEDSGWFGTNLFAETASVSIIDFNGLFLLVFSIAALYFLFGYCITVGVRCIQLAFLEIISPVAIISYLSPSKESNKLGEWAKIYFSTYIDAFLRIAIINFAVYLIAILFSEGMEPEAWSNLNTSTYMFVQVIMIMAILTFAKKAPELLKQLLPSGGGSGLDFGFGSAKSGLGMLSFGAGAITGGMAGAGMSAVSRFNANRHAGKSLGASLGGAIGGLFSGGVRGIASGAKKGNMFKNVSAGINKQRGIDNDYGSMITSGGSSWGRARSKIVDAFGETAGQRATRQMEYLNTLAQHKKNINSTAADMTAVNAAKTAYENITQWEGESIEDFNARKQAANDYWRGMRNAAADASLAGKDSFEYNGQTYQFKDDDMARASQIRAELAQAEDFVESHDVQHWDEEKRTMVKIDSLYEYTTNEKGEQVVDWNASRGNLGNTENYAMETNAHFARDSKYQRSMANDRAAGVAGKEKK